MTKRSFQVSFTTHSGATLPVTHKLFESADAASDYAKKQVAGGMYQSYDLHETSDYAKRRREMDAMPKPKKPKASKDKNIANTDYMKYKKQFKESKEECSRCGKALTSKEDQQTGICAKCWTDDDYEKGEGPELKEAKVNEVSPEKIKNYLRANTKQTAELRRKQRPHPIGKGDFDAMLKANKRDIEFKKAAKRLKKKEAQAKESVNEDISMDALDMEKDHEVQMARAQLYHAARDAIRLHRMLKDSGVTDIDNTMAAKIAKAAEYLASCSDYFEYELLGDKIDNAVPVAPAMPTATPMPMESKGKKKVNESGDTLYLITAEHIGSMTGAKIVAHAEKNNCYVINDGPDPTFSGVYRIIVGEPDEAKYIQNLMSRANNGASVELKQITGDEYEAMMEMASGGATGAGAVAVVSKPMGKLQKRMTGKGKK